MSSRSDIARSAADHLAPAILPSALVGFDGFIDSIVHMVDRRLDMSPRGYDRLRTIPAFASRCASAAGKSANIEQVLLENRFGGNGPLLAGALARLGLPTTFIGAIADPNAPASIHPTFQLFASWCQRAIPLVPPSTTLCAEFDDGKLMFNETASVQGVTWDRLISVLGLDQLRVLFQQAALIGMNNWSLLGGIPGIWEGLIRDILPHLTGSRRFFIDLSDPAKRTDADIAAALSLLLRLASFPGVALSLGLNLAEAQRLAQVCGLATQPSVVTHPDTNLPALAADLRRTLRLDTVVIHPREGAAAADSQGHAAWFPGPLTNSPKLSTGAGDHFNSGFALAQTLHLSLEQALAVGVATSGLYVREGESPSLPHLLAFLRSLPEPETPPSQRLN